MKRTQLCLRFLLLLLMMGTNLLIFTAQAQKKVTVTIEGNSITLPQFVEKIQNQTRLSFIYGEEIRFAHPQTMNYKNTPLDRVLKEVLTKENIQYRQSGRYIVLTRDNTKRPQEKSHKRFTISGFISDISSSETLIGAAVQSPSSGMGTVTNSYGFYTLTLPAGEHNLLFSSLGYSPVARKLELKSDTTLNIRLASATQLQEVVITSNRADAIRSTNIGANDIPMAQIKHTPTILGEPDLLKTIQLMPGVQNGVQGFSGIFVRGGGNDENLMLLDGIPVYNVNHLLGIFSIFTPEAVKKVTLYKSSFPAEFSGRTSSVLDIRTNNGDMQHYHGTISIGLITDKFHIEGPIVKDRTSFHLSGRLTHTLFLGNGISTDDDEKANVYFYDVNAKLNHKFNDKNRIFINFFHGNDTWKSTWNDTFSYNGGEYGHSETEKSRMLWGNTLAAIGLNHIFNHKLFNNTTFACNHYQTKMTYSIDRWNSKGEYDSNYNKYTSGLNDFSFRSDFTYIPNTKFQTRFGAGYIHHTFNPEKYTLKIRDDDMQNDTLYSLRPSHTTHGNEIIVYGEEKMDLTPDWSISAGMNLTLFNTEGKHYTSVQPRFSTVYNITGNYSVKAGYSRMSQYIHLLSTNKISLPTDIWVPITKDIKPMNSDLYSVGAYYDTHTGWQCSVEGYYKNTQNILDYLDGASFMGNSSHWEDKVEMGKGRSYGIEMMIQKTGGRATGWVSYTLAKSERKFNDGNINSGKWYPSTYDNRHNFNICLNYQLKKGIELGATWSYLSGGTISVPDSRTDILTPEKEVIKADYYQSKNNYRIPATHLLNLSINFNKKTKHGMRTWNVSLYNAYNAMNPSLVNFKRKDNGERVLHRLTILPCIPSFSYTYRF